MAAGTLALFTICSNNYVPMAKVWADSARRFHPEAELFLCLADRRVEEPGFYPDGVRVIEAQALPIEDFAEFAFRYDMMEFNTAIKPFMFRFLLDRRFDAVLYFDPDIEIFAPLTPVLDPILRHGASLVLTPHLTQPSEGDAFPDDIGIMQAGIYNLGFLGVGAGAESERILRWWSRRLRYDCINAQERGVFVDQKFMDLVPGFGDRVVVLRDTTCNVAYWNLSQRRLGGSPETGWTVDGAPLTFFHFSGISPQHPRRLSKYTLGFTGDAITPPLASLMHEYAARLLAHGYGRTPAPGYAYGRFASGTPIPAAVRRMFRERHVAWAGGDPFSTYERFLDLPIPHQWSGDPRACITHLMEDARQRDPELLRRFSPTTREGVVEYTRWFIHHGQDRIEERRLLEPVVTRWSESAGRTRSAGPVVSLPRVDLIGYLRLALGIGEAGRQLLRAVRHSGAPVRALPVALNSQSTVIETGLEDLFVERADAPIEIYSINADQLPQVIDHLGDRVSGDAYRIMMPFWELESFPQPWCEAFDLVDEIWAPTRFIQAALARSTRRPVHHMPLLLDFEAVPHADPAGARARFGLPADTFLFFFAFDYFSFIDRKNPQGAVEAFRRAFAGRRDVAMVMKTQNFAAQGAARDLHDLIEDDPQFIHVDRTLSREDTLALLSCCDAVVSLHRSEGLGLLVAEAMALGKPVVATDYSATNDLVSETTGWPVDFRLVALREGQYPFADGQVWAEPDLNHAAWQMRRVVVDADERARRTAAARAHLTREYGLQACAARVRARLARIAAAPARMRQR